jgi:small multidrug resistance pump
MAGAIESISVNRYLIIYEPPRSVIFLSRHGISMEVRQHMNWSWIILLLAIVFDVLGTLSMKSSQQFTRFFPSIMLFVCYGLSFVLMTIALRGIDVSIAYAIWSGLGTFLVVLAGISFFKEPAGALKFIFLGMIIIGTMGLNLVANDR